jgi:ATP-dependent Clp endopeptidase proteolytic subunit ClpP
MKRTWFKVENSADTEKKIQIYDEIGGWGIRAIDLINEINSGDTKLPLNVYVNSPGGDLVEALAIFNAIQRYEGDTTVYVDGIAASAASYIAMAFDKVVMPKNTMMMIHDPISYAVGNADEMRDTADLLDKFKNSIISGYANKSGKTAEEISALLSNETWISADEALEMGFADEVIDPIEVVAISKVWNFKNAPQNLIEQEQPADTDIKEVVNQEPPKEEPVIEAPKAEEIKPSEPEKVDAVEVAEICMIAKVPHMTAEFLKSGMTIGEIKNKIISMQAERNNQLEIETVKNLGSNLQAQSSVSKTAEIYARLNQKK